MELLHQR